MKKRKIFQRTKSARTQQLNMNKSTTSRVVAVVCRSAVAALPEQPAYNSEPSAFVDSPLAVRINNDDGCENPMALCACSCGDREKENLNGMTHYVVVEFLILK